MNQILFKKIRKKNISNLKTFFLIQIIISTTIFTTILSKQMINYKNEFRKEKLSIILYDNLKLLSVYSSTAENDLYYCSIQIPSINVNYPVFSTFSDEYLKISPCRFYGDINNNLCIVRS